MALNGCSIHRDNGMGRTLMTGEPKSAKQQERWTLKPSCQHITDYKHISLMLQECRLQKMITLQSAKILAEWLQS